MGLDTRRRQLKTLSKKLFKLFSNTLIKDGFDTLIKTYCKAQFNDNIYEYNWALRAELIWQLFSK